MSMPNHKPNPNLSFEISTLKPAKMYTLPKKVFFGCSVSFGQILVLNMQQVKKHTHSLSS